MTVTPATAPSVPRRLRAGLPLLGASVLANLLVLAIGTAAGAAMTIDNGGTLVAAGPVEVTLASVLPLLLAVVVHATAASRVPLVARAWTPVVVVLTLLSLGGLTGATDLTTAVTLGTMHLVVGGLAAFAVPARLDRRR